jgi:hypothetical protein
MPALESDTANAAAAATWMILMLLSRNSIGRLLAAFCAHHLSTKQVCLHWTANID